TNDEDIIFDREYVSKLDIGYVGHGLTRNSLDEFVTFSSLAKFARRQVKDIEKDLLKIESGWVGVGCKRDIPPDACYVGCFKDRYAWVRSDGLKELSDFTIHVLNFASLIKENAVITIPGGPRFTPSSGGR